MKVLGLALYGPLAASHRYRLAQYVPVLARDGIDLHIHHLLGDDYLRRRFAGKVLPWASVLRDVWGRFAELLGKPDVCGAILHCELFPMMPGGLERRLLPKPYIYDFDDAFYLKYRRGRLGLLRPVLGRKFDQVMAGAAAITAGNAHLAEYAGAINPATHLFPTVVDTLRYVPLTRPANAAFTIGWVGSPSTAPYLDELIEPLSVLGREGPVRFVVVGGKAPMVPGVSVEEIPWCEATEVQDINRFDLGVMPLSDDAWAQGKCAFKLIQSMACGVPVVASRVGANLDVVAEGCGYLAADPGGWVDAFRVLRDQPERRRRMGATARAWIERNYSLAVAAPRLSAVIKAAFGRDR